ncbi:MAG: hypothetical protein FWF29_09460, partial [Treponema sp.]|nr:hypothetical protein [Treponema sp.]
MKRKSPTGSKPTRIAWHPAFFEALQMELNDYRHVLEFHPEYQLTYEPLKIDCVVIKKIKNIQIEKNIATIFREWNIIEYKSPTDYVSVEDFYKVYAYACFYAALNKVSITSMTITFVENRYPKKLLTHLCKILGYTVEESDNGIYTVNGNIIPIQIIDRNKLSLDENVWLRGLSDRLDFSVFNRVTTEATR